MWEFIFREIVYLRRDMRWPSSIPHLVSFVFVNTKVIYDIIYTYSAVVAILVFVECPKSIASEVLVVFRSYQNVKLI